MAAIQSKVDSYFQNLSSVSNKIYQDSANFQRRYENDWNALSPEAQDCLLDEYLIDPKIAAKYSGCEEDEEEKIVCFPRYVVSSGEKIVVDFDHDDGWTWQDEHSGPFSWKTKSQQDLTLAEIDELGNEPKEESRRQRALRRSRSPERPDSNATSGFSGRNEVEQIFQKFGITYHNKDDESNDEEIEDTLERDTNSLEVVKPETPPITEFENQNFVFGDQDNDQHIQSSSSVSVSREGSVSQSEISFEGYHGREMLDRTQSSSERSSSTLSNNSRKGKKGDNKGKEKKWKLPTSRDTTEAQKSLIGDLSVELDGLTGKSDEDIGQVSPIFIEDSGESSTDNFGTTYSFPYPQEDTSHGDIITQPSSINTEYTVEKEPETIDTNSQGNTAEEIEEDLPKSGFAFLDNW